jgi:hypothetical protein
LVAFRPQRLDTLRESRYFCDCLHFLKHPLLFLTIHVFPVNLQNLIEHLFLPYLAHPTNSIPLTDLRWQKFGTFRLELVQYVNISQHL